MLPVDVVPVQDFGAKAADHLASVLRRKAEAVIGFPTGNTPLPLYQELLSRQAKGQIALGQMRAVMLDDYLGARPDQEISFRNWLDRHLFMPAGLDPRRILPIPTQPQNIAADCRDYENRLSAWGGCDLLFLGLGLNGHVGFNEPGADPDSITHVTPLSQISRQVNAAYWKHGSLSADLVPEYGVTMGLGTILRAREIILLVRGAEKAGILARTLHGEITPAIPASLLRRHARARVLCDVAAAGELKPSPPQRAQGVES